MGDCARRWREAAERDCRAARASCGFNIYDGSICLRTSHALYHEAAAKIGGMPRLCRRRRDRRTNRLRSRKMMAVPEMVIYVFDKLHEEKILSRRRTGAHRLSDIILARRAKAWRGRMWRVYT